MASNVSNVHVNGNALREIMQSENAQAIVNSRGSDICGSANDLAEDNLYGHGYVLHTKVLDVSAHAFIDCGGTSATFDNYHHDTLQKAFWQNQGR